MDKFGAEVGVQVFVRHFPYANIRAQADCIPQTKSLCLFDTKSAMKKHLTPEERLDVIRNADQFRKWNSLDDNRVCVVCDRIFNGRQIDIKRDRSGHYLLRCPTQGCPSYVAHWFFVKGAANTAAAVSHGGNGHDPTQAAA